MLAILFELWLQVKIIDKDIYTIGSLLLYAKMCVMLISEAARVIIV